MNATSIGTSRHDARNGRRLGRAAWAITLLVAAPWAAAQGARIPGDAVDAFHAALKKRDGPAALALLDREMVAIEFGVADPTVDVFARVHLPFDFDIAAGSTWAIDSRRVGGEGDQRWVLTGYHVTGKLADGTSIDQTTLETMILQRSAGLFRIVHMHWSTNDPKFQALTQAKVVAKPADR